MSAQIITDKNFDDVVLKADKPVLVNFTATWAAPCRNLAATLNQFADKNDHITVAKIDAGGDHNGAPSDNPESMQRFDIRVFPTLLLFRNGRIAGMSMGEMNEEKLKDWTQSILDNPAENDITPADFPAYSAQLFEKIEEAQKKQIITAARKLTLGVNAAELAGLALYGTLAGPFGMAVAAPAAIRSLWQGTQALLKKDELPKQVTNKALSTVFNLSAAATGIGLTMAPAGNWGIKAACIVFATYFMAVGSLRFFGDLNRKTAPESNPPPAP